MIRGRKWLLWPIGCLSLLFCLFVGTSLWLFHGPFGWVLFLRGPESYRIDFKQMVGRPDGFEKLHVECASLVKTLDGTNYFLSVPTNLPPVLAELKPQCIGLHDDPAFVNIQVCGGFFHRGLLVSLDPANTNVPSLHWLRGRIAPGIYEWKE
jgi:hypothetical protein